MLKDKSLAHLAVLTPRRAYVHMLFETVMKSRSGLRVGKVGDNNMKELRTKDQKKHIYIEEMEKWIE